MSPFQRMTVLQLYEQIHSERLTCDMHIFLFSSSITLRFFFFLFTPFTNYFPLWIVNNMSGRAYLVFESKNPKTFHRLIRLLQSESISLRPRVKALISFIQSKRNTSMQTCHSKSYSADTSTNNRDMWISICIDRCIVRRREDPRALTSITLTYVPMRSKGRLSYLSRFFVSKQFFLIETLRFIGEFLYFFTTPITLGTDGPMVCRSGWYGSFFYTGHIVIFSGVFIAIVVKNQLLTRAYWQKVSYIPVIDIPLAFPS